MQGKYDVAILILAAGASRRMRGEDKLMRDIGGQPLLRRSASAACASKLASEVLVVLDTAHPERSAALNGLTLRTVIAFESQEGLGASLRAGVASIRADADAVVIALADMPDVTAADYDALIAAFDPRHGRHILRAATPEGQMGHPVLFDLKFRDALMRSTGDQGARYLLKQHAAEVFTVTTQGAAATTDLDTPEDWAAYQAQKT